MEGVKDWQRFPLLPVWNTYRSLGHLVTMKEEIKTYFWAGESNLVHSRAVIEEHGCFTP